MRNHPYSLLLAAGTALVVVAATSGQLRSAQAPAAAAPAAVPTSASEVTPIINRYCATCHNERMKLGGLVLQGKDLAQISADAEMWEKVAKKLHAKAMPPVGSPRPSAEALQGMVAVIETSLDKAQSAAPNPGRPPIHRMNRFEYANAVRDLLGLEIDSKTMLPADDTGYGFDNIADVLTISPGLFERYMLAASKISRLAVQDPTLRASTTTYELPYLTLGQDERMSEDLPFGSRGGASYRHYFPLDGEYTLHFTLQRNDLAAGYSVRGLGSISEIDVRIDRQRVKLFKVGGGGPRRAYDAGGEAKKDYPDDGLEVRFQAKAGMHTIGVTFNRDDWETEGVGVGHLPLTNNGFAQGIDTGASYGRVDPAIEKIEVAGPFDGAPAVGSDNYRRVFVCQPATAAAEEPCAKQILARLARLAYRRPVAEADMATLMKFYREGRTDEEGTFVSGVQMGIGRILVDPNFLFRLESDPKGVAPGSAYQVTDLDLASRLSFFLWSSIPDDELLTIATQGKLRQPAVLQQQVKRMLADARANALMDSFFGQWLTTRNIATQHPDPKVFPSFDENLRRAFQEETQLFLRSQIREDRPAMELLNANYTFANERLAKHYGIPGVVGNHFRRVTLPDDRRGGLLGQGSVLTVTSYNDRTSVVVRGKWIMDTVFGTPPPPPPPNVPQLSETKVEGSLRQRMEIHRKNPVCASCHNTIDPLGFGLENFDGVGQFRTVDAHVPIDPSGKLADGAQFDGPASYRKALLDRQDAFLSTMMQKLMTYGLGRGVETYDMPSVRKVLRDGKSTDYRWSALILGIVQSQPFQMRRAS